IQTYSLEPLPPRLYDGVKRRGFAVPRASGARGGESYMDINQHRDGRMSIGTISEDHQARIRREAQTLANEWSTNKRWSGIRRDHTAADVVRLRGSILVEHTLARRGAERLWRLLEEQDFVSALGVLTGN